MLNTTMSAISILNKLKERYKSLMGEAEETKLKLSSAQVKLQERYAQLKEATEAVNAAKVAFDEANATVAEVHSAYLIAIAKADEFEHQIAEMGDIGA
jgi:uncharacterized coiled-coil DUF342 family protein